MHQGPTRLTSLRERCWIESSMDRTRWLCSSLSLWLPAGCVAKSFTISRSSLQWQTAEGKRCSKLWRQPPLAGAGSPLRSDWQRTPRHMLL